MDGLSAAVLGANVVSGLYEWYRHIGNNLRAEQESEVEPEKREKNRLEAKVEAEEGG